MSFPMTPMRTLPNALLLALLSPLANAAPAPDPAAMQRLDRMTVVGSAERAAEIPGSADYVDEQELQRYAASDVNRALRRVPGLYLIEEDGYGLRPNIGIRGSGTDRNNRIAVMEDGVLIAPAAYAAPAAYYFPTVERMTAIEVRKGSASIRSGPRTTGGAVNLVSTAIPTEQISGRLSLIAGEDSTYNAHGWAGGSGEQFGFMVEAVQQGSDGFKHIDGGGDAGFDLQDHLAKVRWNSAADATYYQELELKIGHTDQDSNETYLGLTDADFAADPNRRYRGSHLDNIQAEHEQQQLSHYIQFSERVDLTTVVYNNDFARNWFKLENVNGQTLGNILADPTRFANEMAWIRGADSPANAFRLRNNNRSYSSEGVQSLLAVSHDWGTSAHQIELGLRYHEDNEDRFQDEDRYAMRGGSLVRTTDNAPGSNANQLVAAEAWSAYLQDQIRIGDWQWLPGVRYEHIELIRTDWQRTPTGRSEPPILVARRDVSAFIPGLGATYDVDERWQLLAGVHRGYSPPAPGTTVDAEESVNFEAGLRFADGAWNAELIGFLNDYDNLVGTCTASTGGDCNLGDQYSGGEVEVYGVEAELNYQVAELGDSGIGMPLRANYTWTQGEFQSSFRSSFEEWGNVNAGDELPYLPENLWFFEAGLEGERWSTFMSAAYVDDMRTRAGSGELDPANSTDAHWILDLAANWQLNDGAELFAKVDNLLDEEYVASRRPSGVRPGKPQTLSVGVRLVF